MGNVVVYGKVGGLGWVWSMMCGRQLVFDDGTNLNSEFKMHGCVLVCCNQ